MEPHGNGSPKLGEPSRVIGERDYRVDGQAPGAVRRAASEWRDAELAKIEAQRLAAEERAARRKGVAQ